MIVHAPYPKAETRVEREAHAAQRRGWSVDVIATRDPGEPEQETGPDGIRIFRMPVRRVRGGSALVVLREYLGFLVLAARKAAGLHGREPYAVVQVHNPPDFLLLAALVPRLRGARVVFDVHDLAPELFALRFAGRPGSSALLETLRLLERLALRFADAVVTVHEPYRRLLLERGVPDEKIVVALNSPEEELIPDPVDDGAASRGGARFRVVYHGTITPHYGLATLVDAAGRIAADVPSLALEIYGAGDALPDLKRQADELGIRDRFTFSDGFLGNREVLERVRGADVGVIANLAVERNKEALPTKLFEYAAMGIPVVSSDLPAIREYFSDDEVRFSEPGDAEALARALAEIAHDPAAARERAERARVRYESYRWNVSGEDYLALLARMAERRG